MYEHQYNDIKSDRTRSQRYLLNTAEWWVPEERKFQIAIAESPSDRERSTHSAHSKDKQ